MRKTALSNDLTIITVPQANTQIATVLILVGTGSKYETKNTSGVSHFLEHLLFKGTKKRPSHLAISEPLDAVGGIYNAFTSEEYTGYYAKVDSLHLDLALDILSDIYLNSQLPVQEVEKERGVIIEEINMYADHPSQYVQILWNELLYPNQPAGWNIAGSKETVSRMSREDIFKYFKKQYTASNTLVCVAGGFSPGGIIAKIKKHFSKINSNDFTPKTAVAENQRKPAFRLCQKATDQAHLCFGARAYNLFHPQKYAQEVLADILGGMMSSRLFTKIREELGLAYYIATSSSAYTDTGYIVTQAGVDSSKIEKAVSAILTEYRKLAKDGVPQAELNKSKDHLKGKMALLLETSDALASFYGLQEILEKEISTPAQIYAKIDKVSKEDIKELARDIFRPSKINLALIGPFKDRKKFLRIINF